MNVTILEDDAWQGEPSDDQVRQYAEFLGIDLDTEPHLKWIAREGVVMPVPMPWKACTENDVDVFFFNFETGESIWDHPCAQRCREMVQACRTAQRASLRSANLAPLATAAMGATKESKPKSKIAVVAPASSASFRFLPSRAMKAMLDDMWCSPITDDEELVALIQYEVETKCDVRSKLLEFPSRFPGFVDKILEFADVTQEDIDDAWLAAALDLLGRPAIRHVPTFDLHMQYAEREHPFQLAHIDGQGMSRSGSDVRESVDFDLYEFYDVSHSAENSNGRSAQFYGQLILSGGPDARAGIAQSSSYDGVGPRL